MMCTSAVQCYRIRNRFNTANQLDGARWVAGSTAAPFLYPPLFFIPMSRSRAVLHIQYGTYIFAELRDKRTIASHTAAAAARNYCGGARERNILIQLYNGSPYTYYDLCTYNNDDYVVAIMVFG